MEIFERVKIIQVSGMMNDNEKMYRFDVIDTTIANSFKLTLDVHWI